MKTKIHYLLSVLFVLSVLFTLTPLKTPTYALGQCASCRWSNCCGVACSANQSCVGDTLYGCDCVQNTPTPQQPTKPPPSPTTPPTATPLPTTIPNLTLSPYEERCGSGKCTNGYYCCQNRDGSPACCPVGTPPGGGGGTNPTNTPTPTRTPTPTPTPAPFIKLKNTSFYTSGLLINPIPQTPSAYDTDDDASANFIIADAGLVAASSLYLTGQNSNAKPNPQNQYLTAYDLSHKFLPTDFSSYIKARKTHTKITSLSQISQNGIWLMFS